MTTLNLFRRCPKTRRIVGIERGAWPAWSLVLLGLLATIWYAVRVLPKPTRAAYPCLTATAPARWAFFGYLASLGLSTLALHRARRHWHDARYLLGTAFAVLFAGGVLAFVASDVSTAQAAFLGCEPAGAKENRPSGTARGLFPGRVVWAHDPGVASYTGAGNWWDTGAAEQDAADEMMEHVVQGLSGAVLPNAGWAAIFEWFNVSHGRGDAGYRAGEKIAVKINQNNQGGHQSNNDINGNPTLILALLRSLVYDAGIEQSLITVYDASRAIGDNIYDKCHGEFPQVVFMDHFGGDGRVQASYLADAIHYSADNGELATGLATAAVDATYLINLAILKGHGGQGVTLGGKNQYGMTSISNDWTQNKHDHFNPEGGCSPRYMTFTDWMAHRDMGEKTLLWMVDAIYPTYGLNGTPNHRWSLAPFNGHWPASVLASLDGVANESVALDFYRAEWDDAPDLEYADQYLHEAARADDPPSGTFYDPEGDGVRAPSLGVHEHWNNATDKQYSRNLGTGNGIELAYMGPGETQLPLCGDGHCNGSETCASCDEDCGDCDTASGPTDTTDTAPWDSGDSGVVESADDTEPGDAGALEDNGGGVSDCGCRATGAASTLRARSWLHVLLGV